MSLLNSSLSPKDQIMLNNQTHPQEIARTLADEGSRISNIHTADQLSIDPRHRLQEGLKAKHFSLVLSYGAKDGETSVWHVYQVWRPRPLRREACQLTIILSSTSQDILPTTWHPQDERIVSDITQSSHLWGIPRGLELRHASLFKQDQGGSGVAAWVCSTAY